MLQAVYNVRNDEWYIVLLSVARNLDLKSDFHHLFSRPFEQLLKIQKKEFL